MIPWGIKKEHIWEKVTNLKKLHQNFHSSQVYQDCPALFSGSCASGSFFDCLVGFSYVFICVLKPYSGGAVLGKPVEGDFIIHISH